jgi:hypothetical protein
MMLSPLRLTPVLSAFAVATAATLVVDPPDLRINTVSGLIETVDATWSGSNYNVRWTSITTAGVLSASTLLTTNTANDVDPRIGITSTGDVVVAWWRDLTKDAIIYRKRAYTTGAWAAERTVGLSTESNSHPRLVISEDKPWVAYQIQNSKSRSVGAQIIDDDPEPFRSIITTTTYGGDLDIQLNAELRHLWVTWIDGGSNVGYSEYSYEKGMWTVAAYESFASDSVAAARERIRDRILGL